MRLNHSPAAILFHGPHILPKHKLFAPLSRDLALESINNCDNDLFDAERSVEQSGEGGSGERWSGTRLRLPSAVATLSVVAAFSA